MSLDVAQLGCLALALQALLVGHGVLVVAGAGRPGARSRGPVEWGLTALAVGAALDSLLVMAVVIAVGPLSIGAGRLLFALPLLAGLAALAVHRRLGGGPAPLPETPTGAWFDGARWQRLGTLALGAFAVVVTLLALGWQVHLFDPVFHFTYKAKVLFHEGIATSAWTDLDGKVGRVMTHPSYPPGVGALTALASWPLGAFHASAARGLGAVFVLAPAAWLYAALRPSGRGPALAAALAWTSLPVIYHLRLPHALPWASLSGLMLGPDWAEGIFGIVNRSWLMPDGPNLDGGGDLPLAAFGFGALVHLWRGLPSARAVGDRADLAVAAVLGGGALVVKNEGLGLVFVTGLALGLALLALRARPAVTVRLAARIGAAVGCALLLAAPWFLVRGAIPAVDENYPELLTPSNLRTALTEPRPGGPEEEGGRYAPALVGAEYLATFFSPLHWSLLWPLFFAALLLALRRPRALLVADGLAPALFVLGGLGVYFLILVVTPWSLAKLFTTGIPDRLFLHLAPAAVLASALLAWPAPAPAPEDDPE